ncbi:MAG TPA: hypothetical protein VMD56_05900 [Steroidobacteraceae bacterium]|nr:hypothetical protein [Steroidobacteraceae bacterium]
MNNLDRTGIDSRKQAVSIRMNRGDVRNIKRLAERLGARDSDVIRFAIKLMLSKLSLLQDPAVRGRSLVPVFLEVGPDLMRHFELDVARLASIINDGVDAAQGVDPGDIQLLAMHGLQRSYLKLRVASFRRVRAGLNGGAASPENSNGAHAGPRHADGPVAMEDDAVEQSLRQYLYDKYLYSEASVPTALVGNSGGGS